jgi:hypothetical protein
MLRVAQELEFIPVEAVLAVGQHMGCAKERSNDEDRVEAYVGGNGSRWEFGKVAAVHGGGPQDRRPQYSWSVVAGHQKQGSD